MNSASEIIPELLDEQRACRLREELGRRGWLLSWQGPRSGALNPWLARLSGPESPLTVERRGRCRVEAIRRATEVWRLLQADED